jgi:hypothetical protein
MDRDSRRSFLRTGGAALLGLGNLGFLGRLPSVSAADAKLDPNVVRLNAGIEPLVCLLEETPQDRLVEEIAVRIKKGLSYRDILAALLLAGVRNVEPRPQVGFKFHAVLAVNSCHLASLAAPDRERWLPIFWALDYFKVAQARNRVERHGWRMAPLDESKVPPARKARQAFAAALESWDPEAADVATAGLVRAAGADEVFEAFLRYAPRDFRSIGHKVIFTCNARRTLDCIGWQHAEPVLRSLAYALVNHDGDNPAKGDHAADRAGRRNRELIKEIRAEWEEGKSDGATTTDLLAALRVGSDEDVSRKVIELLNKGSSPASIWDALLNGAGELLSRRPGIVALHAVTTANALRYAFATSASDETRKWLLLQAAAFLPLFRNELVKRGGELPLQPIDKLEPLPLASKGEQAVEEIFVEVSKDRASAARKVLSYLKEDLPPKSLMDAARVLIFLKGNDAHDYKFSSAVLEDYDHVSPAWRQRFLATSMFSLRGSQGADNPLVKRVREALKG